MLWIQAAQPPQLSLLTLRKLLTDAHDLFSLFGNSNRRVGV